jgi:hypothetical protein
MASGLQNAMCTMHFGAVVAWVFTMMMKGLVDEFMIFQ